LFSQTGHRIRGRVTSEAGDVPVAGCSVFISGSSKGTVTDASGTFELSNCPVAGMS
jgi:hypothetical protein